MRLTAWRVPRLCFACVWCCRDWIFFSQSSLLHLISSLSKSREIFASRFYWGSILDWNPPSFDLLAMHWAFESLPPSSFSNLVCLPTTFSYPAYPLNRLYATFCLLTLFCNWSLILSSYRWQSVSNLKRIDVPVSEQLLRESLVPLWFYHTHAAIANKMSWYSINFDRRTISHAQALFHFSRSAVTMWYLNVLLQRSITSIECVLSELMMDSQWLTTVKRITYFASSSRFLRWPRISFLAECCR